MNIRRLLPILAICLLTACQKDFDELNDTRQRWVEFSFDPSEYFSDILVATEHGYELGASTALDPNYKLRIVGYCYDADSVLIAKNTVFGDMQQMLTMEFKHLDKDCQYHFLFLSDIVQFYSDTDYYEIWYQLLTRNLGNMYVMSQKREKKPAYNVLLKALIDITPSNQTMAVPLSPITFNGYCAFTNHDGISASNLVSAYHESFFIRNMEGRDRPFHAHVNMGEVGNTAIIGITASYADKSVDVRITNNAGGLNTATTLTIQNPERRPFVATIDYNTLQLTKLELY